MSTNMTGGADGGIAIQVKLDTSKASKELTRLEQKILKLQEEVTVGKAKKSALVAQLEQANAELTALQAKTKIDGKSFVISPEDSKRISDLKIQIEQTQTAIEQQNKALSDAQLTLEGVKTRYGEVTQQAQALCGRAGNRRRLHAGSQGARRADGRCFCTGAVERRRIK